VQPATPPPLPKTSSTRPKPLRAKPAEAPDEVTTARRKSPLLDRWLVPTTGLEVVGREDELARLRDATERREARGSMLVGSSGVGKGAVLRALARETGGAVLRLGHADVMAALRGDEAEAARAVLAWAARGHAVVALDPVAAWTSPRETPDDVLAPMRAWMQSGRVAWVGVATPEEARRLAESDPWIERSAQRVDLDELPHALVVDVVVARARALSSQHGVAMPDELARRAVALCDRFVGGRAQPERTLTVLDLGLARARREGAAALDDDTLCEVVAGVAGLPKERVASSDHARLLALEEHLAARVVGHRAALARVADVVRRNAVGFRGQRPLGTFLLLGPTGVGKTETAKALAEALFPGDGGMSRFDMAEYTEAHAVARLVGAPPGYVGYGEGGQLTEAVKRRPWQLILLDEIEKAHRDVLQALLGLLDEGRMTDGRGRTADFRNTLIVMTSNLGAEAFQSTMTRRGVGFASARGAGGEVGADASQAVLDAARASLPPELWNRIDEPLVFGALSRAEVAEVARRLLADRAGRLEREQGVSLVVDPSVVELLLDGGGYDVLLGARPMRRAVARLVEAPLAEAVLRGRLPRGASALVRSVEGSLRIEVSGDP
jgi:ATP-dependent Clp protease ATP-binding subunit ClpC